MGNPTCFASERRGRDPQLWEDNDEVFIFPDDWTMADLAVVAGKAPSKNQAKKNGWGGEIPYGWTEKKSGKTIIYISKHIPDIKYAILGLQDIADCISELEQTDAETH